MISLTLFYHVFFFTLGNVGISEKSTYHKDDMEVS